TRSCSNQQRHTRSPTSVTRSGSHGKKVKPKFILHYQKLLLLKKVKPKFILHYLKLLLLTKVSLQFNQLYQKL
uniref:hypothetical protein n=1 Tax=Streptococcus mitis TaxID=28037 RepID=UPI003B028379